MDVTSSVKRCSDNDNVSPIILSALMTFVLVFVFYISAKPSGGATEGEEGEGEGEGASVRGGSKLFLLCMAFGFCFFYGLTFVRQGFSQSAHVASIIGSLIVAFIAFWGHKKGVDEDRRWLRWICVFFAFTSVSSLFTAIVLAPLQTLKYDVERQSRYYYSESNTNKYYIGAYADIRVDFGGIPLKYVSRESGDDSTVKADDPSHQFAEIPVKHVVPVLLMDAKATPEQHEAVLLSVLSDYDAAMKTDNRYPRKAFVQSMWSNLKTRYRAQSKSRAAMVASLNDNLPGVLQYLKLATQRRSGQ